jgi:probable rRNA maturation factor
VPLLVDNDQTAVELPPGLTAKLETLVDGMLGAEGLDSGTEVSLLFVDDRRIAELNRQYRGQDRPTDVLSFAMREQAGDEPEFDDPTGDCLLGDVVVSLETAARQSREYGHSLEREVAYLLVHGVLHLLGYDHGDEESRARMRVKEEEILSRANLLR